MSHVQASLSLPGSPFNLRRGSRGSHQFTLRNTRRMVAPPGDRKPLVLSTYLDAQEHLPYADDSNAVTPMSEENGVMVLPMSHSNLGTYSITNTCPYMFLRVPFLFLSTLSSFNCQEIAFILT